MLISFENNNTIKSVIAEIQTDCNFTVLVAAAYKNCIQYYYKWPFAVYNKGAT